MSRESGIVVLDLGDGTRAPYAFLTDAAQLPLVLRNRVASIPVDAGAEEAWTQYVQVRPDAIRYASLADASSAWEGVEGEKATAARQALERLANYVDFDERR